MRLPGGDAPANLTLLSRSAVSSPGCSSVLGPSKCPLPVPSLDKMSQSCPFLSERCPQDVCFVRSTVRKPASLLSTVATSA